MNKMICVRFSSNQTNKLKSSKVSKLKDENLGNVVQDVVENGVEDNGDYCNGGEGEDGGECGAKIKKCTVQKNLKSVFWCI